MEKDEGKGGRECARREWAQNGLKGNQWAQRNGLKEWAQNGREEDEGKAPIRKRAKIILNLKKGKRAKEERF